MANGKHPSPMVSDVILDRGSRQCLEKDTGRTVIKWRHI